MTQTDEVKLLKELGRKYGVKIPKIKNAAIKLTREEIARVNSNFTATNGEAMVIVKRNGFFKCYTVSGYISQMETCKRIATEHHIKQGHKTKVVLLPTQGE